MQIADLGSRGLSSLHHTDPLIRRGLEIFRMIRCGLGLSISIFKLGSADSSGVALGRIPAPLPVGSLVGFAAYARLMVWFLSF